MLKNFYLFALLLLYVGCSSYIDSNYSFTVDNNTSTLSNDDGNNDDEETSDEQEETVYSLMEVNVVDVGTTWTHVAFTNPITNPIIIVGPPTMNNTIPTSVRVRNLDTYGFDIRLYDQTTGTNHTETVAWLAIEEGKHTLSDGTVLETGTISTQNILKGGSGGVAVSYETDYANAPIVYSSTITFNNDMYLNTRVYDVSNSGFYVGCDPLENVSTDLTNEETISWLAITPAGTTLTNTKSSDDNGGDQTEAPRDYVFSDLSNMAIFSSMQTRNGGDPIAVRISNISGNTVTIKLLEDTADDSEQNHGGAEQVYVNLFEIGIIEK